MWFSIFTNLCWKDFLCGNMKYQIFKINSYSTFISVQILVVKLPILADRKTVLIVSFLSIQVLERKQNRWHRTNDKSIMQHNSSREDNLKYSNNCKGIKKKSNQRYSALTSSSLFQREPRWSICVPSCFCIIIKCVQGH